jgi:hypothetical protein
VTDEVAKNFDLKKRLLTAPALLFLAKLFCTQILGLYFFGAKILAQMRS